jgi:hypothetical protein
MLRPMQMQGLLFALSLASVLSATELRAQRIGEARVGATRPAPIDTQQQRSKPQPKPPSKSLPKTAAGQQAPERFEPPSVPAMLFSGILTGAMGMLAGGFIGAEAGCGDKFLCELDGAAKGVALGAAAGVPIGVNLSSGHAPFVLSFGSSMLIGLATVGLVNADDGMAILGLALPLELASTMALEVAFAKRKLAQREKQRSR